MVVKPRKASTFAAGLAWSDAQVPEAPHEPQRLKALGSGDSYCGDTGAIVVGATVEMYRSAGLTLPSTRP
jgi:hypothetical protein